MAMIIRHRVATPTPATKRAAPVLLAAVLLAWSLAGGAATTPLRCQATSPAHTQALVELFTSQGCSSCPPADRWMAALQQLPAGKPASVTLSWHVDYWDYIGWKDPHAQAAFTRRQYAYARLRGVNGVYTPQVVLAGQDFPQWRAPEAFLGQVRRVNERPARAQIRVDASLPAGESTLSLGYALNSDAPAELHLVLFENGLSNRVPAGENRGQTLSHDRVAREWVRAPSRQGQLAIRLPAGQQLARSGIVAFAQTPSGEVLQSLSCDFLP